MIVRRIDVDDFHKQHFACFACRKSFKQMGSEKGERPFRCPDCGVQMAVMGKDFKSPPKKSWEQWIKVEGLVPSKIQSTIDRIRRLRQKGKK